MLKLYPSASKNTIKSISERKLNDPLVISTEDDELQDEVSLNFYNFV